MTTTPNKIVRTAAPFFRLTRDVHSDALPLVNPFAKTQPEAKPEKQMI